MAERDYLKKELGMFLEQIGKLEKENALLSKELQEKKDLDEFESLEEGVRKENEAGAVVTLLYLGEVLGALCFNMSSFLVFDTELVTT